jgi:hypothetical protein
VKRSLAASPAVVRVREGIGIGHEIRVGGGWWTKAKRQPGALAVPLLASLSFAIALPVIVRTVQGARQAIAPAICLQGRKIHQRGACILYYTYLYCILYCICIF